METVMHTHADRRFVNSHVLRWSIVIVAILMLAQLVTAQTSSWSKQNADGTTTTVEILPGGGARVTTKDANGNVQDTVTTVPDGKYGPDGSKVTVQGTEGKNDVDIEVYRDASGKVREIHYTNYGEKNKYGQKHEFNAKYDEKGQLKSYEKKINNKGGGDKPYPPSDGDNEGIADEAAKYKRAAEEVTKARFGTEAPGVGAATKVEQPKMSPTEKSTPETPADNGGAKPSKTPEEKDQAGPSNSLNPRAPTMPVSQPTIVPSDIVNYLTNFKEPAGLYTIQFTAPNKDILEVYLPRHLSPGPNMGSMHLIPGKAADGGLSFEDGKLQIGDTTAPLADGKFSCDFRSGDFAKFRVIDRNGRSLGGVDFPITDIKDAPVASDVPTSATFGELIEVNFPALKLVSPLISGKGPDNFEVKIGDQEMPKIAANAFGFVTRVDYNHPGLTYFQVKIGDEVFKKPLRVLTLKLSAGSLNLDKGESTTVHIIAEGLENLKAPAHMTIDATGTVTMDGATAVELDPKMIASDGTYITDRSINAKAAGGFSVDVTVKVDKEPSEEKVPKTSDKKVSIEDAEKRIKVHLDYITKRNAQMAVAYYRDGAKETLEDAFKKGGVDYSTRFAEQMAKGLAQFWSDEGNRIYMHSYDLFEQYLKLVRRDKSATESYLHYVDQALETWKQFDQMFAKQFQTLVDLYTKEALLTDKLHAIEDKYTDQVEELRKKQPRPKKEIDELERKQEAELKPIRDEFKATEKEIDKVKRGTKDLGAWVDIIQGK
jgi:hypothetical protein